MSEFIQIHWTTGSLDEARKVSRYLVQERLIASAEIIPWIEKIYLLNGQLETIQESKLLFITQLACYEEIKKVILNNSSYEIPEITYQTIEAGNEEYFNWLTLRKKSGI
jgi:periplasmic divalent cation tolerance protein